MKKQFGKAFLLILITFTFGCQVKHGYHQTQKLSLTKDSRILEQFIMNLSMSDDGKVLVIGTDNVSVPHDELEKPHSVYILIRDKGKWTKAQEIIPAPGKIEEDFSRAISISADGSVIAIGARNWKEKTNTVYIYKREGMNWGEINKIVVSDHEGISFANTVCVSPDGNTVFTDSNGFNGQNSVSAFSLQNGSWRRTYIITSSDRNKNTFFADSISITRDGKCLLVQTIEYDTSKKKDLCIAYIFRYEGDKWIKKERIDSSITTDNRELGNVSISADGIFIFEKSMTTVLGKNTPQGCYYIYSLEGDRWIEKQKLLSSDGDFSDHFGNEIALSSTGQYIAIGASHADIGPKIDHGAVYFFKLQEKGWIEEQKILPFDGRADYAFGSDIAISADGSSLAIGAIGTDQSDRMEAASIYFYQYE